MEEKGRVGGEGMGREGMELQGGVRWEEQMMECTKYLGKWCIPFISTSSG